MFVAVLTLIIAAIDAHSRSFFRPRDVSTDSAFELSQVNYHRYHADNEDGPGAFFIKPFFMRSARSNRLARYFLPNNKACISLDESGLGDVDPLWFSLIAPAGSFYTSNLTLAPQRTIGGLLITLYVDFCDSWWVGLNTAPMHVTTNDNLCETNRTQTGTIPGFADAYDAFNNPSWNAGKITNFNQKRWGLDDIQFKLGYDFYKTEDNHATAYLVGTIPTGKGSRSCFIFEPLVGSNHASFGCGFNGDFSVCDQEDDSINIMTDIKYRYIFSAQERRSFDLCANGDWSRYLLVVTQNEPIDSQPAINLLTGRVKVFERNTVDFWLAAHYQHCDIGFELGYDLWWRQAEKICKKCPITPGFAIQTLSLCQTPITSASTATISQAVEGPNATISDAQFTPIVDSDLNLTSAAHPNALSNKLYAALDYTHESTCGHPWVFGLAGSYELGNKNALDQWAIWLDVGLGF